MSVSSLKSQQKEVDLGEWDHCFQTAQGGGIWVGADRLADAPPEVGSADSGGYC